MNADNCEKARESYEEALRLEPGHFIATNNLNVIISR